MPNYDVKCKSCDYNDEWFCSTAKYARKIKRKCPKCGKKTLFQDMTNRRDMPFVLRGLGWTIGIGTGNNTLQEQEDAVHREHDQLKDLHKTTQVGRKREEAHQKAIEKIENHKIKKGII